jgi:hypothetical protein
VLSFRTGPIGPVLKDGSAARVRSPGMRVRKRLRRVKRLVFLGGLVGGVYALRQAKARRDARTHLGEPATWPPLQVAEPPVAAVGDLVTAADSTGTVAPTPAPEPVTADEPVAALGDLATEAPVTWVAPDETGGCPLTHPVKANGNSGIFHVPGGQFYDRTRAERCYADAAAAEADGYRAAKGS